MKSSALQRQITQRELESKMIAAVAEFWKTREQTPPPTRISIAEKYGVPVSTLKARILGRTSKIDAAAARQKIHPCEEEVLVAYLKETSRRGFPDTRKRCVRRANEILRTRTGNPSDRVIRSWFNRFLPRHHDELRCSWSNPSSTLRGVSFDA